MGKPYKMLALDIDGTLLNSQNEISDQNRHWIRKAIEAGVTVVLATGRGYPSALPFAQQLELASPMVLANGSEIWRTPGILHQRLPMSPQEIIQLRELAVYFDTWYWAYSNMRVFNKNQWIDDEYHAEWLKFGYYTEDTDILAKLPARIAEIGRFEMTNSHPLNLELNPKGVSKASGLREVCSLLGIDMKEVVACGDSLNDTMMIREAGLGVAMGNAQDEVKQWADIVTCSNDEDGVAQVIQEFLLHKGG